MTRHSILASTLAAIVVGTGLAFVLIADGQVVQAGPESAPRPVVSVTARAGQSAGASFAGVVQARIETDLAFRILGRVISRKAEVGDLVRSGDVLAEIDPLALQLAVTSAEADTRNAEAQLQYAKVTEKRKRALAATSAGSVADQEFAEQGLKSAEADAAMARASLDKAREQLGYAQLKAEFDGVVTATSVEVGQTVIAGQSVLTLARLGQRDAVVDVSEAELGALHLASRFNIALQLDDSLRTSGLLREISPEADAVTRTYRLKIALEDAPDVFRLGSVVTATANSAKGTISLPSSAILAREGTNSVWVVDPQQQTVSLRAVSLAPRTADASNVRILSGLREGEEVAVAGVNELREGQRVVLERKARP